jgi:hypothetical protein
MFGKRSLIAFLAGMNLFLLALLLSQVSPLPSAFGQAGRGGGGGGYVCATAKPSGRTYEVFYMIDLSTRKLHAFYPASPQFKEFAHAEPRELDKDFGK